MTKTQNKEAKTQPLLLGRQIGHITNLLILPNYRRDGIFLICPIISEIWYNLLALMKFLCYNTAGEKDNEGTAT